MAKIRNSVSFPFKGSRWGEICPRKKKNKKPLNQGPGLVSCQVIFGETILGWQVRFRERVSCLRFAREGAIWALFGASENRQANKVAKCAIPLEIPNHLPHDHSHKRAPLPYKWWLFGVRYLKNLPYPPKNWFCLFLYCNI